MERFEKAQVGDLVYNETFGEGEIMSIYSDYLYVDHIGLTTKWNKTGTYYDSVKANKPMPCLFYRKGEERYLTERPDPEIDWTTIATGTICFVKDHEEEPEKEREFLCFIDGKMWFKQIATSHANPWKYARIKP